MHLKLKSKKAISLLLAALLAFAMLPTTIIGYALPGDYSFSAETGELSINTPAGIAAWTSEVAATDVKSVIISEEVTEINSSAFQDLTNLESVTFEGDISFTVGGIFAGATSLKTIVFNGESSLSIGAFNNAHNIETITFGGKTKIANSIFGNCSKLTELTFPAGSTFGVGSFSGCPALEKATFEGDVDLSAGGIFSGTPALKTLVFKGKSKISNGAFAGSSKLESISFGEKTEITNGVFSDNSKLTELTFPAGSIFGPSIFCNYTALEKVTFEGDADISAGGIFSGTTALKTVVFKGESKISNGAFDGSPNIQEIFFGGKTQLGNGMFRYISKLTELTIPAGSTFGMAVFSYCPALEKVTFEGDVDLSAGSVFSNTTGLKEIVFNGESKLGNNSFSNAENLKTITFAKKTFLNSGAFNEIGTALEDKTDVIVLPEGSTVSGSAFCGSNVSGIKFTDKTPQQNFDSNIFNTCEPGTIIYVPCVSLDAYTAALNGSGNTADSLDFTIEPYHTFVDGICECGELAPVMPVTVNGGSGSGDYYDGATVTIKANAPAQGKAFDKWIVESGNVVLADENSAETTFVMGSEEVTVTATYKNAPIVDDGKTDNSNQANTSNKTENTTADKNADKSTKSPATGADFGVLIWAVMLLVSGTGVAIATISKKKKQERDNIR